MVKATSEQDMANVPVGVPAGTFTNTLGETYQVYGLSPLIPASILEAVHAEYVEKNGALPTKPTYTVTTKPGDKEVHEHDERSILEGSPEQVKLNKAAWASYIEQSRKIDDEYNLRLMRAVFMAVATPVPQSWRDEMHFIGAKLPKEGSPEERYMFVETHVVKSAQDLAKLMVKVFRMSGVIQEEDVAKVEATFQGFMERAFAEAGMPRSGAKRVGSKSVPHRHRHGSVLGQTAVRAGSVRAKG